MKGKRCLLIYGVFLFSFFVHPVYSEENTPVQPNVYKEYDIDIDTNHFHEEERLNQKSELTEEQKALTFERKSNDTFKAIQNNLFSEQTDANMITAKTEGLKLFSKQPEAKSGLSRQSEDEKESSIHSFWLLGILTLAAVILGSYLFLVLVPKIQQAIHFERVETRRQGAEGYENK